MTNTGDPITDAMIEAGVDAWLKAGGHDCDSADLVGPIFLAMQSAAQPDADVVSMLADRLQRWATTHATSNCAMAYDLREAAAVLQAQPNREVAAMVEQRLSSGHDGNPYKAFTNECGAWNEGFTEAWDIVRAALPPKEPK